MARMMILLNQDEQDALAALASRERRDLRDQAALLIRHELQNLGLLSVDDETAVVARLDTREKSSDT